MRLRSTREISESTGIGTCLKNLLENSSSIEEPLRIGGRAQCFGVISIRYPLRLPGWMNGALVLRERGLVMPQVVPCLLCGHAEYRPFREDHGVQIVRCRACSFLYVNPQPTNSELERLYSQEYYGADTQCLTHSLDYREAVFDAGLEILMRLSKPGRLLDDGCGTGNFVRRAQRGGWQAMGVELSERAARFANEQGLDVRHGTLAGQKYPSDYFDVVTLWDVLEHLSSPRLEIHEIHRVLKPGGTLIVRVPNTRFQLMKAFYCERLRGHPRGSSLQADLHLSHFTSGTLRFLLQSEGLSVFGEEGGVSENKVIGGGAPLWFKRLYCDLTRALGKLTSIQLGPSLVQYACKDGVASPGRTQAPDPAHSLLPYADLSPAGNVQQEGGRGKAASAAPDGSAQERGKSVVANRSTCDEQEGGDRR